MRSVHERVGEPWPHEMVIDVDRPNHVLTLLFVRETWGINSNVDLPELAVRPDPEGSAMPGAPSPSMWAARWDHAWREAWEWYDPRATGTVVPAITSPRRSSGVSSNPALPPMWETEYGSAGINRETLWQWTVSLQDLPATLGDTPERRNLPDLIAAWRDGINSVIVLPFATGFAQRITTRHFVVSSTTRDDSALYGRALRLAATSPAMPFPTM